MSAIIQAENVSKLFRLGTLGTGSLRQDISLWWQQIVLKKKDVFFQANAIVGEEPIHRNFLWALNNINFEINEGEVVGFIGRNGAGKSTLLKILSRIIPPTEGIIKGRGKISSLLEVGTGFHGDLSGRENIFISGYMLGMKKMEILKKFDEIIDFSGIEEFIDTPVKRYSSGMYVRLAFAVAAFLDPDILIVDEVLAVGDAEFQKKCLGKMKDVSRDKGRTILFVSHNMQAVSTLCEKAIWLQKGAIRANGESQTVINEYLNAYQQKLWKQEWNSTEGPGNNHIKIRSVELIPDLSDDLEPIDIRTKLTVAFQFNNFIENVNLITKLQLFSLSGECIFEISTKPVVFNKGLIEGQCVIPGNFLNDGSYYFSVVFVEDLAHEIYKFNECLHFDVEDYRENLNFGKWLGSVRPQFPFNLKQKDDDPAFFHI